MPAASATPALAAIIDLALIRLFGLQHSIVARPGFKENVMRRIPAAFECCAYVHAANFRSNRVHIWWHKALFHVDLRQTDDPDRSILQPNKVHG